MQWTIGRKIMGSFLAVITVVAMMSGYTYYKVGDINDEYQTMMNGNQEKLVLCQDMALDIANEAVIVRKFIFAGDSADIQKFADLRKESDAKLEKMQKIFVTEKGQKAIAQIKADKAAYEAIAEKAIQARQANNPELVLMYMQQVGTPYNSAAKTADEIVEMIKAYVKSEQSKIDGQVKQNQFLLLILNLAILIIGVGTSIAVSRNIARPAQNMARVAAEIAGGTITAEKLEVTSQDEMGQLATAFNTMKVNLRNLIQQVAQSAEQVAASSEELTASADQSATAACQIAGSITDVAKGAEAQLAAANDTSAVVTQISAGIQQVAVSANDVAGQSAQAAVKATAGNESVGQAVTQMAQIEQTVNTSAAVVARLGERSKEIGQIIDTISGIAGQTNLLALNAAIEAARAGEQGRGFAVVAEEVRKLAEQSQGAAQQIASLIGEIQTETDKAVSAMNEGTREVKLGAEVVNASGQAFLEIAGLVSAVSGQVKEISVAIEQMAAGSQQIVGSVQKIDTLSKTTAAETQTVSAATQEQSASMEEIAASSQALAKLAMDLRQAVAHFHV